MASLEAKVGAFVLGGLALIATALFLLGDVSFERRYTLYVNFSDVGSLANKAPVKLSGVEVGSVRQIELADGGARVVASVRRGVRIYNDAVFTIGSTGIIGSKYLEIDQGRPESGVIAAGSTIHGTDPVDIQKSLTQTLNKLDSLLSSLTEQGPRGSLADNLRETVANVRELTADLDDLVATTKPKLAKAMDRTDEITRKLDDLLGKTNQVMTSLSVSTQGAVGALLHDEKLRDDVKKTVADVREAADTAKDVLGRINQFRVYWNYDWRYEHAVRTSRADIGLFIYPRETRYYYLGGANLANINDAPRGPHVDYVQPNKVDALLGFKRGMLDFAFGVIRSGGGARLTFTPFYGHPFWDGFSLMAQGHDFGRNRVISGRQFTRPQYDFGALMHVYKALSIGARVEDVQEVARYQTWAKILFEDKDISYLFGLATFGAAGTKSRSKSSSH